MKGILFFGFLLITSSSFSQDTTGKKSVDSNTVIIHKDPRLDSLIKKQAEINEIASHDLRRNAKGFRILIINTTKRNEAAEAKSKVYNYFPELKAYLIYQSPYYRLKAGNFIDRNEAENYQKKLEKYFPKGVIIVNDIIEVNPDKETESSNSNL
ncbi:MAG TPA: SPOR domain-containing protein [Chitinophagaceae bacterium]|nr:SPOR domain-containing protein [Chitinophagaceae bacterium]